MFYLISSKKYFYCREAADLLVTNPNLVKVGDKVNFSFGSKSFDGEVLATSGWYYSTGQKYGLSFFRFLILL